MKNFTKTLWFTILLCILTIFITLYVQLSQQSGVSACSYLDPITIDILALSVAIFLVIEGIYKVSKNYKVQFSSQLTRSFRIAIGCAIITIHILQFLHK